jgi:hypothetical protein
MAQTDDAPVSDQKIERGTPAKPRPFKLAKLSSEDLRTLRLDEGSEIELNARFERFRRSRDEQQIFKDEDPDSMDSDRLDEFHAAGTRRTSDATAIVHFMAPRILRLRDGTDKRRWRSFLTKFMKDENLA